MGRRKSDQSSQLFHQRMKPHAKKRRSADFEQALHMVVYRRL